MKPRFIKLFLALFLPFASFLLLAHFLFYYNNKYENNPVYRWAVSCFVPMPTYPGIP